MQISSSNPLLLVQLMLQFLVGAHQLEDQLRKVDVRVEVVINLAGGLQNLQNAALVYLTVHSLLLGIHILERLN